MATALLSEAERKRREYEKTPEALKRRAEAQKRYRAKFPDRVATAVKAWITAHPEYEKNRGRRRYAENPKRQLEATRKWVAANPEKARAIRRAWTAKDGKGAEIARRYKLRKRKALPEIGALTVQDWWNIRKWYEDRCAYCFIGDVSLEQDHVIPLTRGGLHTPDNVVPACRSCNASKSNRILRDWLRGEDMI